MGTSDSLQCMGKLMDEYEAELLKNRKMDDYLEEIVEKELQADLDADGWETYQVIDPDNVEPPAKEDE